MKKISQVLVSILLVSLSCNRLEKINQTFLPPEESTTGTTAGGPDTIAPSIVTGISFTGIGSDTITINWGAASDNMDLPAALQYKLVKDDSSAANILSVTLANAKSGADLLMDWTSNVTLHTANGLAPLATYYFVVLVRDVAGNIGLYSPASQSTTSLGTLVSPEFSPAAATYSTGQNITISSSNNAGGNICYTTDGNFPAAATPGTCSFGMQIANGATVNISTSGATILRAMATRVGATNSSISSGTYTIDFPPVAGTAITFSNITQTSLRVNWGVASDAITATSSLQYKVVKDDISAANISTVALANAKSGADLLRNWSTNILFHTASGLAASQTYYFAILVRDTVGNITLYTPTPQKLTGGALDVTYDIGTGTNGLFGIYKVSQQADGKIIITDGFSSYNEIARNGIVRTNSDGSIDASFAPGSGASAIYAHALQNDGKIVIGGTFTSYNGTNRGRVARINTDGTLDATFDPGSGISGNNVQAIAIQSDGKIIFAGQFTGYNGTARNHIVRVNTDGSLDSSFAPTTGPNNPIRTIALQSDGKILAGGDFTTYDATSRNYLVRINTNGTLDSGFLTGSGFDNLVYKILIQPDDKIVAVGNFTQYNGTNHTRITRLGATGVIDSGFNPGTGANANIWEIAAQSDGKLIIGGTFTTYNGTVANQLARIQSDGSIDTSFTAGTGTGSTTITGILVQSDGRIVIAGPFTSFNSTSMNRTARIFP